MNYYYLIIIIVGSGDLQRFPKQAIFLENNTLSYISTPKIQIFLWYNDERSKRVCCCCAVLLHRHVGFGTSHFLKFIQNIQKAVFADRRVTFGTSTLYQIHTLFY